MNLWNFTNTELKTDLSNCYLTNSYNHTYGSKLMRFFFESELIRIKNRRNLSFIDWLEANEIDKPYNKRIYEWKKQNTKCENTNYLKYSVYQIYGGGGSQNIFKVSVAKWLMSYFKATSVLDFCSGYGGRCLGAITSEVNYIGYDTNLRLTECYSNLIKFVKPKSKVQIYFENSTKADFSKHTYDMVLTSPPYYDSKGYVEKYDGMTIFKTRNDFNNEFFYPVVRNSYKYLSKNGWFCLNIPKEMYNDVKLILGEARITFPYPLKSNNKNQGYTEKIYCWKKCKL